MEEVAREMEGRGEDGGGKGKILGLQVEVMVESRALAAEENGELDR